MTPQQHVAEARHLRDAAQLAFEQAFKAAHPPGSYVEWKRGVTHAGGHVVSYGAGEKLRVRRISTGGEYTIRMGYIVDAYR